MEESLEENYMHIHSIVAIFLLSFVQLHTNIGI